MQLITHLCLFLCFNDVHEDDQDRSKYVGVMTDCVKSLNLTLVHFWLYCVKWTYNTVYNFARTKEYYWEVCGHLEELQVRLLNRRCRVGKEITVETKRVNLRS